jgi:uncharacterized membrane protein YidH (DUF202 family)
MRTALLLEMIAVGIFTIVLEFFVYRIVAREFPWTHLPHFNSMLLGAFILGASMHFILEVVGVNESWCRSTFK